MGVLGPDTWVVKTCRDGVGVRDLAVGVGEARRARAVQHGGSTAGQARRAGSLYSDEAHVVVVEKAREESDRIRPAAHASHDSIREAFAQLDRLAPGFP